jgi:hypothetical protein
MAGAELGVAGQEMSEMKRERKEVDDRESCLRGILRIALLCT